MNKKLRTLKNGDLGKIRTSHDDLV